MTSGLSKLREGGGGKFLVPQGCPDGEEGRKAGNAPK